MSEHKVGLGSYSMFKKLKETAYRIKVQQEGFKKQLLSKKNLCKLFSKYKIKAYKVEKSKNWNGEFIRVIQQIGGGRRMDLWTLK